MESLDAAGEAAGAFGSAPDAEHPPRRSALATHAIAALMARPGARRFGHHQGLFVERRALSFKTTRSWYHAGLLRAASLLFASALTLLALSSCSAPPRAEPVPARTHLAPEAPPPPWAHFDEIASVRALNARPFLQRGHDPPRGFADVRANAIAEGPYLELVSDTELPEGSILALFFCDETRSTERGVYVMHKRASGWNYLALDSQGRPDPRIDVSACPLCHDGAPADNLFGLPRHIELAPALAPPPSNDASESTGQLSPERPR